MTHRVAITGIGVVSPLGIEVPKFWDALVSGRSAISVIDRFDTSTYSCRIGGQVDDESYLHLVEPRLTRTTTHVTRLALAASELALNDARLGRDNWDPDEFGVCVGTAIAGLREAEQQFSILLERGARRVNPFVITGLPSHGPGAHIAARHKARGGHFSFGTGCTASLQAIAHGASLIRGGSIELCLVGGAESPLLPTTFAALTRMQELAIDNEQPQRASRPFDISHAGMVLTEGSCFLLLESFDHAMRRNAHIHAEILGAGSSCDANGMYHHESSGLTAARMIHRLMRTLSMSPEQISYVCAHANSSPAFDRKEIAVLKRAFGEFAVQIPVSSIKGVLGHPFGASGAFQVAAAALALQKQVIPPTHNLEFADPECDLDCVGREPRDVSLRTALITSYGYGGVNSCLILRSSLS